MDTEDVDQLRDFAKNLSEDAGDWESDIGSDESLQDTNLENLLNQIRNLANELREAITAQWGK